MAGIYIHIPFCKQKCSYCNFHFSTRLEGIDDMINAIKKEIVSRKHECNEPIETIYFGGGTPSILSIDKILQLVETIETHYTVLPHAERTIECNPDDINKTVIKAFKRMNFNRISLGVQSFFDADLQIMNRAHTAIEAKNSILLLQDTGFTNLTIDLIYGIPSSPHWEANLAQFFELSIDHLSAYALTVEPKTQLNSWINNKKIQAPTDEKQAKEYDYLISATEQHLFEAYEISNFARNKQYAQHNTNYWRNKTYLGFGPSAHSYHNNTRRWNISNNLLYNKHIHQNSLYFEEEKLSEIDQYNEIILTNLRTQWGLSQNQIQSWSPELQKYFEKESEKYVALGILTLKNDAFIISKQHRFQSDGIASDLFFIE